VQPTAAPLGARGRSGLLAVLHVSAKSVADELWSPCEKQSIDRNRINTNTLRS